MAPEAVVKELLVHPVKSCQGISLNRAHVSASGFRFDRSFAVFDVDNFVQDLRVLPKLATIKPAFAFDDSGREVALILQSTESKVPALRLSLEGDMTGDVVTVCDRTKNKWWGMPLQGRCCGEEAANWLMQVIGKPNKRFKLVRYDVNADTRRIRKSFSGKSSIAQRSSQDTTAAFADCAPYHLINLESLHDLNGRLAEIGEQEVTVRNFRPNIVVGSGEQRLEPYKEDEWASFDIVRGGKLVATFRKLGETARCVIPSVHPFTGVRNENEQPREMLSTYRPMPYGDGVHGGPTFGLWLACDSAEFDIEVGDCVRVGSSEQPLPDARKVPAKL
eukprot:TRINITY_DN96790_c0_g1_i1.p1 TRINITY_DN96790_c0_g1~~TRINITY_DN96790_c0_g1_i1.p1  ORF type:complete len:333 (-),score=38.70 TRINITY_DN96790_c0_g1_i1:362-1360(-)